ncbi:flagellar export chaperone FlgN [Pseudomonas sp. PB3P13]
MTQRAQLLRVIEQDLAEDLSGYEQMSGLMTNLYDWLMARDCPQIELANQQISSLVDAASLRARRRTKVLHAVRLSGDARSMEQLFTLLAPERSALLETHWSTLTERVMRCRALNERNGKLLAMHSDILQQLFNQQPESIYHPSL